MPIEAEAAWAGSLLLLNDTGLELASGTEIVTVPAAAEGGALDGDSGSSFVSFASAPGVTDAVAFNGLKGNKGSRSASALDGTATVCLRPAGDTGLTGDVLEKAASRDAGDSAPEPAVGGPEDDAGAAPFAGNRFCGESKELSCPRAVPDAFTNSCSVSSSMSVNSLPARSTHILTLSFFSKVTT